MSYKFREIEAKWQRYWAENQTFRAENDSDKEKYYVLDMFPYPSGAGLHVGHPLGYIASDIYARYKRHKGYNVLHPQGYDSFGLPAEQYAIQTGQHPAITTEENIKTYRRQLDRLGFSFDWSREVRTSDPDYYKWTQWIFIQLFNSWYNNDSNKAEPITALVSRFERGGNASVNASCDDDTPTFSPTEWKQFSEKQKQQLLLKYRLTYLADTEVNWCPALGTVLANDEIVNGVSERGGHPIVRKKMTQWSMRITAYAQRLLNGLEKIDWPQPLKDAQTNWIGRSVGAEVEFRILPAASSKADGQARSDLFHTPSKENGRAQSDLPPTPSLGGGWGEVVPDTPSPGEEVEPDLSIKVFTTRPDTIFGASFMTLAPEHELVRLITTPTQKAEVEAYIEATARRSELDRLADVNLITGAFTGAHAEHPFTKEPVPIWIGDYVLAGYGTGAVMSVPCGDQRDHDFAKHFNIPIPNIFEGVDISEEAFADKENTVIGNSDFLNGLSYKEATKKVISELEKIGRGKGKINYRLRDAVFSRQRYWGEPFPVYYVEGMPQMISEEHLPLVLPEVEKYLPTESGDPPLGNATEWAWDTSQHKVVSKKNISPLGGGREGVQTVFPLELNTMPGWAGSSQYFNRYMDPHNDKEIFSQEAVNYWRQVDLYIGGIEHATGHLLYSRFWQKFMYDKGLVPVDEYAKKLINQGMILGNSAFVYRWEYGKGDAFEQKGKIIFVSQGLIEDAVKKKSFIEESTEEFRELFEKLVKFHGRINTSAANWANFCPIHVDVAIINSSDELDIEAFKNSRPEYKDAEFILENGKYFVGRDIEKMSKSKYNVVNPDTICEEYGADSLRMYEMFLGPLEQAKPWNTAGITGVHSFLKKLWRLYHSGPNGRFYVAEDSNGAEGRGEIFKTLHKTIKKVEEDIENFSFNTSVSTFMICVNELSAQKCTSRDILEPLAVLISPYAPHIAEELWEKLGNEGSVSTASFPKFEPKYLVEDSKEYPISFNGKMRFTIELPLDMSKDDIEAAVMAHERTQKQLQGRTPKKVIVVPGKIVNIVG